MNFFSFVETSINSVGAISHVDSSIDPKFRITPDEGCLETFNIFRVEVADLPTRLHCLIDLKLLRFDSTL
jgi:hypothetical protein